LAYRAIFLNGFMLIAAGFLGFTVMHGFAGWLISAYLVGFGTGASNTVASLFVVEFTPESEWSQRISWLQTFNALGAVLGMAIAGLLQPASGTLVAASLVIPAIIVGGCGLPVPRSHFHIPRLRLHPRHVAHLARHGGSECSFCRRPHSSPSPGRFVETWDGLQIRLRRLPWELVFLFGWNLLFFISLSRVDVEELWGRSRDVLDVDVNRDPG
jgi:MFS family permease